MNSERKSMCLKSMSELEGYGLGLSEAIKAFKPTDFGAIGIRCISGHF